MFTNWPVVKYVSLQSYYVQYKVFRIMVAESSICYKCYNNKLTDHKTYYKRRYFLIHSCEKRSKWDLKFPEKTLRKWVKSDQMRVGNEPVSLQWP